jgi:hypothetical protein
VNGGDWQVVVQKEPHVRHVVAMVEDMTLGADIDKQDIMAFVDFQTNVEIMIQVMQMKGKRLLQ